MKKLINNIAELKEILPYGAMKDIALQSGTSIFTVSRVFSGKSNNVKVIKGIVDYIKSVDSSIAELERFNKQF